MKTSVVWFRRDLRLCDNEAVVAANDSQPACLYVFVIDPWFFQQPEIGLLRVKFLFESLAALDAELRAAGNRLVVLRGNSVSALIELLGRLQAAGQPPALYFNEDIQVAYGRERDDAVTAYCQAQHIPVERQHNYFLLHDESKMDSWWGQYYAYQQQSKLAEPAIRPLSVPLEKVIATCPQLNPANLAAELGLDLPVPRQALFQGGEPAGRLAVYDFLRQRVQGYHWKISRPYLAQQGATSLLGPHLAFGTVSSRTVYQAADNHRRKVAERAPKKSYDIATYLDRLRWRDSFTQRLWFHPELIWQNRFPEFDTIYSDQPLDAQHQAYFDRWKAGTTGFPLLDAAMRQLSADGFINFRMRAMAATFLSINCGVSWHHGATHFMNCLVDGDIAINHWQWQMQAGITNPLSPVFRMYNPSKNLRERDESARYVHFWLPETAGKSVETILQQAQPMLDFNATRRANGKVVADIRQQVRSRIIAEKGIELQNGQAAKRITTNYQRFSADRYKNYLLTRPSG